jgi:hypothetical protein
VSMIETRRPHFLELPRLCPSLIRCSALLTTTTAFVSNPIMVVESDVDMPPCLNTKRKQENKARELARAYLKIDKSISERMVEAPRLQGIFSRTRIVIFESGDELVVQFRPEELNIQPFQIARAALG